ncbi:excalibur calcium-binding domain-containing protein [Knoellia sp. DB2414S]|uniref:Excalibur calcium-binding domain-containing protein n=2 Tax=Knoellia koreensis TaxID=2730921 RepID=A0A849HBT1_9MICO|nr:excalibur calcium-binding domain-containing protein [Knoellia sp. DB2414S]
MPDPGWKPDASWPAPPAGWRFWVNEYGVPIEAPAGLYGSKTKRVKATWLVGSAVGLLAFMLGVGIGAAGDTGNAQPVALTSEKSAPKATSTVTTSVTSTVTAPPVTTTETLPATTVTSVKTVKAVKTVKSVKTVTSRPAAADPLPLVDSAASSAYYRNCDAARAAGVTPLRVGDPGYGRHLDRDGDGVACE